MPEASSAWPQTELHQSVSSSGEAEAADRRCTLVDLCSDFIVGLGPADHRIDLLRDSEAW